MGVQSLWQILAPVKSEETIECLRGKKLAVDLAIWLVESQVTGMKMMQGVAKPHLRNLFFRVSNFLKLGVKLVFVIDGTPPELKWEEMARRNDLRLGGGGGVRGGWRGRGRGRGGGVKKKSRSHFACWLKECQELLELMGIPCIQSKGEAEAMCAALNHSGMVDGCMTEDGDAFLYGARVVYRNLNMTTGKVDCYTMDDVEAKLGLDRRRLVALAILLGCDYLPKGVPGVGKEVAMKFMRSIPSSVDPLKLFLAWRGGCASSCLTNEERDVRKKSLRVEGFPNEAVIAEFLENKERPPPRDTEWKRPLHLYLQQYIMVKMEWSEEYTQEKVIPLMTLFDLTHATSDPKGRLHPASVVKLRVRQGVQCVEVQWHKPDEDKRSDEEEDGDMFYSTVEDKELFTSVYPDVMELFLVAKETKKAKGRGKKKKEASSSQQEERREEEHHVVMDTASKHPPAGAEGSMNLNQEHLLEAMTLSSQVESNDKNQPRSRELPSSDETGPDFGSSNSASREEVIRQDVDTDNKDMKLNSLSLQDVQEDELTLRMMQDTEKRARPGKKCFRGKDAGSGKESLRRGDQSSFESKSHPLDSTITYGVRERKQTKKVVKVTEDSSTEEMEEVEESFIEVLPLSQRLGCSLRGFVPKSRKTVTQVSSGVASKAANSAGHFSSDEESGLEVKKTFQQLSGELQETNPGEIRPQDSNLSPADDIIIERTEHPSFACAGSEVSSLAIEQSAGSPLEYIMDKGHFTPRDAATQNFNEVIDLTEDSSLDEKCMPVVYTAEDPTIGSPSSITIGVAHRSSSEKKDGENHLCLEKVDFSQEKPEHSSLLQISMDHGNLSYSMKKDASSFMKLDNSLAKFMEELSLVSNSSATAITSVEDNDSVFIVEDKEAGFHESKEKETYFGEYGEERKEMGQRIVYQESVNCQENKLDETNLVRKEQVTKLSNDTAQVDIVGSMELLVRETKEVKVISNDSSTLTEQTVEVRCDAKERSRTEIPNKDVILDNATSASLDTCGSRAEEMCEPLQHKECNHEVEKLSRPITSVKKTVKAKNGKVSKTKKRHKTLKSSSAQDSMLIEDGLMRLLQMMSPAQMLSNSRSWEEEDPLSGERLRLDECPSQSLNSEGEKPFMGQVCFSPPTTSPMPSSPANSKQTAPYFSGESQAVFATSVTRVPVSHCTELSSQDNLAYSEQAPLSNAQELQVNLANTDTAEAHTSLCRKSSIQDSPADLGQTDPSTQEELQAILANSSSACHVSLCAKSSMPQIPTNSDCTASTIQKESCAISKSAIGVHMSPCTNSSRLIRTQLLSMLSQITPGDSPPIVSTMLEKPQDAKPFRLRHQKSNSKGKHQMRSRPVEPSNKDKFTQETIPTDRMPECGSERPDVSFQGTNVCSGDTIESGSQDIHSYSTSTIDEARSNMPLQGANWLPNVCVGDRKELESQGTEAHGDSTVTQSQSINAPRPKTRSLSQPTKTFPNGKRNVGSKQRSCSQPVRLHTRSRSKSSVKGSKRRESMLAMESSLAKILEGLSI